MSNDKSERNMTESSTAHTTNEPKGSSEASANNARFKESTIASTARGVFRKTGKVVAKVTAADVLYKDAKRIRSGFPNLWADIFSGRWKKGSREQINSPPKVAAIIAIVCGALTLIFGFYTVTLMSTFEPENSLNGATLIGCFLVVATGTVQTFSYAYISLIQRRRLAARSAKVDKAVSRKTKQNSTSKGGKS